MSSSVTYSPAEQIIVARAPAEVSTDAMRETMAQIIGMMKQHACDRLLVDLSGSRLNFAVGANLLVMDRLMAAAPETLTIAAVVCDGTAPYMENAALYMENGAIETQLFRCADQARTWLVANGA